MQTRRDEIDGFMSFSSQGQTLTFTTACQVTDTAPLFIILEPQVSFHCWTLRVLTEAVTLTKSSDPSDPQVILHEVSLAHGVT